MLKKVLTFLSYFFTVLIFSFSTAYAALYTCPTSEAQAKSEKWTLGPGSWRDINGSSFQGANTFIGPTCFYANNTSIAAFPPSPARYWSPYKPGSNWSCNQFQTWACNCSGTITQCPWTGVPLKGK